MSKDNKDKESYVNGVSCTVQPSKPKTTIESRAVWADGDIVGFIDIGEGKLPNELILKGRKYKLCPKSFA